MKSEKQVEINHQLIETALPNNLTGIKACDDGSSAVVMQVYMQLRNLIEQGIEEAKKAGKKMLFVIGENHSDRKSLLIEAMVFYIFNDLKINTICYENDPEAIEVVKKNLNIIWYFKPIPKLYSYFFEEEVRDGHSYNVIYTLRLVSELKLTCVGVDLPQEVTKRSGLRGDYLIRERNERMETSVLKLDQNCGLIIGSGHMRDLLGRHGLNEKFHIVAVNSTHEVIPKTALTAYRAKLIEDITWAYSDENAIQINLPDNISQVTAEEVMSLAKKVHVGYAKSKDVSMLAGLFQRFV